ncbi:c-type cytochrome [Chitinophaga pendula]|uniref:di-heme oxidoredictase family protein n=1 Tax=Chitinophaga TaxID=79328 RepID=UPI000BAF4278|nr:MULTISPECIES: di-heme oxidoredictase family protein [Chitinophaga]ASZ13887.1 thiol oxidoreductase [Chitinophaga sp. MD30]UCJ08493.1 c-type cytochrome [Chitinophaga pendula]
MKRSYLILGILIASITLIHSCSKLEPFGPPEDELLDGPVEGLNYEQSQRFQSGDATFNDEVFTVEKGLGPVFVATSCASCHAGDGKGHPFTTLTRFGQMDETRNKFLHLGGPQLQNRAIPGYQPETIPAGATFSRFTPPAVTGLGFLEAVADADILAMADPDDADGDGISGVPNWHTIPPYVKPPANAIVRDGKYICRFGKKASVYNLLAQAADAFSQDIGITSVYNPVDVYSMQEVDPEISTQTVNNIGFYLQTLKAPIQREQDNPQVVEGRKIFAKVGCAGCHKPTLRTGASNITPLSNTEFHPYTDLLLHDMGPALDDGYTEGGAKTAEWRTPPLWGLGLSPKSQGGRYFLLHDGRAGTIEQAIEMHGGEGARAQTNYTKLTPTERDALIRFLKSL